MKKFRVFKIKKFLSFANIFSQMQIVVYYTFLSEFNPFFKILIHQNINPLILIFNKVSGKVTAVTKIFGFFREMPKCGLRDEFLKIPRCGLRR